MAIRTYEHGEGNDCGKESSTNLVFALVLGGQGLGKSHANPCAVADLKTEKNASSLQGM